MKNDMKTRKDVWSTAVDVIQALVRRYRPAMVDAARDAGLEEDRYYPLLPALTSDPDPISAELLRVRMPYVAPQQYQEQLTYLTERGLLTPVDGRSYQLTDQGRKTLDRLVQAAYDRMAELQPLPQDDLERLTALLRRLVEASLSASEPPGKWSITRSRSIDPGEGADVIVEIDQYLSDLVAYRDDAHLAAWQPHDISGHAWEVLTRIWQGDVSTFDEIHEALAQRGWSRDDCRAAVDGLLARGWIRQANGEFVLTERGREVRDRAESRTDEYFFAPWTRYSDDEIAEVATLLEQLQAALEN